MKKDKTILLVVVVAAVLFAIWLFLGGSGEHIEDTNGPDNDSLAVITEEDIVSKGVKTAKGGPNTKERHGSMFGITTSSGTEYSSKKFSGIYTVYSWNLILKSDLYFNLYGFEVTEGNFEMLMVHDGEIIAAIEPGDNPEFLMENVEPGLYELVIAGESAAFKFTSFDFQDL